MLSVPEKVCCQLILNWMHEVVESQLHEEQAGLIIKWSCTEQISHIEVHYRKCQEHQAPLDICFIDFSKAFGSIHRPTLRKILTSYAVTDDLITSIKNIYEILSYYVWIEDRYSNCFKVITGVQEGCINPPYCLWS